MANVLPFRTTKPVDPPRSAVERVDSATWETRHPIPDADARAAALDPHASCIVEAPAGSGKTGLLTQRFLKLLADPATELPEEVLAMTFTRKATAEMNERVFTELQRAAANTPLPATAGDFDRETRAFARAALDRSDQLGWQIITQPQRLNIRSLDAVCMDLADSLPLLSGTGGQQQPVENARSLYTLAARRTLMQLGGADTALDRALHIVLLHRDGSLADCQRLLADMLAAREQWAELVPLTPGQLDDDALDRDVRPRLERSLEAVVCAGLSRAVRTLPAGVLEELTALARRLAHEPGYKDDPNPLAFCANKHLPPEAVAEHLDHWTTLISLLLTRSGDWRKGFAINHLGFALPKADKALLQQLLGALQTESLRETLHAVRALPPARYPDEQWRVARALFHVLRHALAELKLLFSERNECDFNELALAARQALAAESDAGNDDRATGLALSAGGHLRHLLVDEMQDTSTSQYELIRALTQSWDGHSQTLFLVGDPKQSIYLFRQARVERFLRTLRDARLGDIPLQPLRLTANFRSQANLVEAFNATFGGSATAAGIFPPPAETQPTAQALDVPFVEAIAVRDPTFATGIAWHTSILPEYQGDPTDTFDHPTHAARTIRRLIEERLARPLPAGRTKPWSIAILGRTRDHLAAIVKELKAHDGQPELPFRAVDLDPLGELPEVLDALALTRALLHPADRIAWLAVLHAPWCGLTLADLLMLTGDGAASTPSVDPSATIAELVRTRMHLLTTDAQYLLARTWPVLEAALATLGRTQLSLHVDRTWRSLGGDAALAADQLLNVRRFFHVLRELEAETGRLDLDALTARLKSLFAEPRAGAAQIEMMTIHKAKGLEWDYVFVPELHRKPRAGSTGLLNWLELDGAGANDEASILLAPIYGKGAASDKLNTWLRNVRTQRERAEEKRLFYVAVTRAREELHLFAALPQRNGALAAPATGSLLKACWPAAEAEFQKELAATEPIVPMDATPAKDFELALAASAEEPAAQPTIIQRLPRTFDPLARFTTPHRSYATPVPRTTPAFDRPEGSFAVRAFGNVVHRYLQLLATRVTGTDADTLLTELPTWLPRLETSLRGEGLAPALATREAARALLALQNTLADPIGRWLLTPHPHAASESALTLPAAGSLRVDRTFLAGSDALSTGQSHIWIVDFKTTALNDREATVFEAAERAKYTAQLEAYAALRRTLPDGVAPIRLGLYYPLIPRLLDWTSQP